MSTLDNNYAAFRASPDCIDGAIHNTAVARAGRAFDWRMQQSVPAIEIAFANEPHGNMRSVMVVDLQAAKALRDQLDAILAEKAGNGRNL